MIAKIQNFPGRAFCVGLALACVSCSPKEEPNNQRLVSYGNFYLINHYEFWELKFDNDSKIWLMLPDGSTHYVPDIDQQAANDLLTRAKDAGDRMATKSGDVAGNPDRFYDFWEWGFELRFDDHGRLRHCEIAGKSTTWDETTRSPGKLRALPGGVVVGRSKEGPFSDLVGGIDEIRSVFGEPSEIRHYESPPVP